MRPRHPKPARGKEFDRANLVLTDVEHVWWVYRQVYARVSKAGACLAHRPHFRLRAMEYRTRAVALGEPQYVVDVVDVPGRRNAVEGVDNRAPGTVGTDVGANDPVAESAEPQGFQDLLAVATPTNSRYHDGCFPSRGHRAFIALAPERLRRLSHADVDTRAPRDRFPQPARRVRAPRRRRKGMRRISAWFDSGSYRTQDARLPTSRGRPQLPAFTTRVAPARRTNGRWVCPMNTARWRLAANPSRALSGWTY